VIFGIGTDLVEIARVARIYARHGERFANHVLMPEELTILRTDARPERFIAMRFAAKEAVVKALGTGFGASVGLRDVGVIRAAAGQPTVTWSSRGARCCEQLGVGEAHISLADEAGLAVAFAVLMRKP
jgi:holo-[acyl-carrier protein] synthase